MDGIERDIQEKRFVLRLRFDEAHGFLGNQVRRVTFLNDGLAITVPIGLPVANVGEVIERAKEMAISVIESPRARIIGRIETPEMPLTADRRGVPSLTQGL